VCVIDVVKGPKAGAIKRGVEKRRARRVARDSTTPHPGQRRSLLQNGTMRENPTIKVAVLVVSAGNVS
jgi:hypothetical protein